MQESQATPTKPAIPPGCQESDSGFGETIEYVCCLPFRNLIDNRYFRLIICELYENAKNSTATSIYLAETTLFRHSFFLDQVSALLRNDSLTEIVDRNVVYIPIFKLLKYFANQLQLSKLATDPLPDMKELPGLLGVTGYEYERGPAVETSAPLINAWNNTYRQAKSYLAITHNGGAVGSDTKVVDKERDVSKSVVEVYEAFQKIKLIAGELAAAPPQDSATAWKAFMEQNRVTFTDDVLDESHKYFQAFKAQKASARNRLNRISKELANMTTSLPDGIFLKVAESRSDVMKALIVGVNKDSPYFGGLFP